MATRGRALSVLVHAFTKVGKSTLGATTPPPRLLLDAEAAYRFLPIRKTFWDPLAEPPPKYDETWDTCVVLVRQYSTLVRAIEWLECGLHDFESVTVDSISEVQKKCKDQISGSPEMQRNMWNELLWHMESLIRRLRDLTEHPTRPLTAVVLTSMTEQRDGKYKPYVQGQLRTTLPYFIDVVGYLFVETVTSNDPTQPGYEMRRMLTRPHPQYEAGERVQGRLPAYIDDRCVNITWMLDAVFGVQPPTAAELTAQTAPALWTPQPYAIETATTHMASDGNVVAYGTAVQPYYPPQ